jgi:arabinose-5-phosphate isomerase
LSYGPYPRQAEFGFNLDLSHRFPVLKPKFSSKAWTATPSRQHRRRRFDFLETPRFPSFLFDCVKATEMPANQTIAQDSHITLLGLDGMRRVSRAKKVFQDEAAAIETMRHSIAEEFSEAVELLLHMRGNLIVTGIGKAGLIGQKIAATFASTGTPSHFVHPSEAMHGDLGRFQPSDVVLVLSNSGETEEVTRLIPCLRVSTAAIIAITSKPESTLGKSADVVLCIPVADEACSHKLAPTTSTAAMLAMGDALALVVSDERGFQADDFARFHPGGSLGTKLKSVDDVMRSIEECRVAEVSATIREVIVRVAKPGRRTGAVMLVDAQGKLVGLFTDSDLARLLEKRNDSILDQPIANFIKHSFLSIASGSRLPLALSIIADRKISELPVIDSRNRPIGLIDITDVVAYMEHAEPAPIAPDAITIKLFSA